jgi:hypothetical protein
MRFSPLRFLAILILVASYFFCSFSASALQCRELFASYKQTFSAGYDQVYGGQTLVGKEYATYKALRDAGLSPFSKLKTLNKKQRRILENSIAADLKDPLPAVRDPLGRIFLLDGHHTVLMATILEPNTKNLRIKVALVYDALTTKIAWDDFLQLSIQSHWFYAPTAKTILENPLRVHELANSVERSMLGLFFISIEDTFKVPMKGKYFTPFIQFYLADLVRAEQIFTFTPEVDFHAVAELQSTLLGNQNVIDFLKSQLRPEAPTELKAFFDKF